MLEKYADELTNLLYWRIEALKKQPEVLAAMQKEMSVRLAVCPVAKVPKKEKAIALGHGFIYPFIPPYEKLPFDAKRGFNISVHFPQESEWLYPHSEILLAALKENAERLLRAVEYSMIEGVLERPSEMV